MWDILDGLAKCYFDSDAIYITEILISGGSRTRDLQMLEAKKAELQCLNEVPLRLSLNQTHYQT